MREFLDDLGLWLAGAVLVGSQILMGRMALAEPPAPVGAACMARAAHFLGRLDLGPRTLPQVEERAGLSRPGGYFNTVHGPWILVRPDSPCWVMVHELTHHVQWERAGPVSPTGHEWMMREMAAYRVQLIYQAEQE